MWTVLLVERLGEPEATTEQRAARGASISNAKLVVKLTRIYARSAPREGALRVLGLGWWNRRDERLRRVEETATNNDALIEEINGAYRRLSVATENLASADRSLAEYVRRIRLDNAEAILEAKNERTASLYLDGLLDTDEHQRLEADRTGAEIEHQHARREVERLHLIVRLLGVTEGRQA
jgi:hypothetical protein